MSHYLKGQEALISSCTFSLLSHLGGIGEKGASLWRRASHLEVWNKTLFSEAVECTCNRFNLTAAVVSYLSFVWFIFPPWCWSSWKRLQCSPDLSQSEDLQALHSPRVRFPSLPWARALDCHRSTCRRWDLFTSDLPSPRVTGGMSCFGLLQGLGEPGNSHLTCCEFKIISKLEAGYHSLGLSVTHTCGCIIYSSAVSKEKVTSSLSYLYLILGGSESPLLIPICI